LANSISYLHQHINLTLKVYGINYKMVTLENPKIHVLHPLNMEESKSSIFCWHFLHYKKYKDGIIKWGKIWILLVKPCHPHCPNWFSNETDECPKLLMYIGKWFQLKLFNHDSNLTKCNTTGEWFENQIGVGQGQFEITRVQLLHELNCMMWCSIICYSQTQKTVNI